MNNHLGLGVYLFPLFGEGERKKKARKKTTGITQSINLLQDICCEYFHKDFYYVVHKQHIHARWVDWNIKHLSEEAIIGSILC